MTLGLEMYSESDFECLTLPSPLPVRPLLLRGVHGHPAEGPRVRRRHSGEKVVRAVPHVQVDDVPLGDLLRRHKVSAKGNSH